MDISPREVIALFRAGDIETILKSKTIWTCASCYVCQTRCPELIKITDIIYALKRTAMDKKIYSKRFPVQSLADAFVKGLNKFGRVNEPRLLARFLLKTGFLKAFSFIPLGYQMAKKGRVGFQASRIKDIAGLKKIIDAAQKLDMPIEIAVKSYQEDAVGYKAIA
jgi:heterodisulfide reductase subunit C